MTTVTQNWDVGTTVSWAGGSGSATPALAALWDDGDELLWDDGDNLLWDG